MKFILPKIDNMKKPNNKVLVDLYKKKGCNVSAMCSAIGCTRSAFYKWIEKDHKLAEMIDEAKEAIIDFAESKLIEHINDGDVTSLIFFLKTKGKKRGYVEKIEQDLNINPFEKLMQELPDDE